MAVKKGLEFSSSNPSRFPRLESEPKYALLFFTWPHDLTWQVMTAYHALANLFIHMVMTDYHVLGGRRMLNYLFT